MNVLEKIICYIGGADIDVLKTCPIDKQKFMVLGIGVLNTSILSMFTMGFAIYSVTDISGKAAFYPLVVILFWGFIILSIDWGLLSTIHKKKKYDILSMIKFIITILFRLFVTLIISFTVSIPLEIIVFKDNLHIVKLEMQVNYENKLDDQHLLDKAEKSRERLEAIEDEILKLDTEKLYQEDFLLQTLSTEKEQLTAQYSSLKSRYDELINSSLARIAEAKRKISNIEKKIVNSEEVEETNNRLEKARHEYTEIQKNENNEIKRRNAELERINQSIQEKQQEIQQRMRSIDSSYNIKYSELERIRNRSQQEHNTLVDGVKNNREQNKEISGIFCQDNLISNIVAMSYIKKWEQDPDADLGKKEIAKKISFVSLLLTILIMVVDTAPIIIKLLIKRGCYEEEKERREQLNHFKCDINSKIEENAYSFKMNSVSEYQNGIERLRNIEKMQYEFNEILKRVTFQTFEDMRQIGKETRTEKNKIIENLQYKLINQLDKTKEKMFDVCNQFMQKL